MPFHDDVRRVLEPRVLTIDVVRCGKKDDRVVGRKDRRRLVDHLLFLIHHSTNEFFFKGAHSREKGDNMCEIYNLAKLQKGPSEKRKLFIIA